MSKRFDKRIHFIKQCILQHLTPSATRANDWYCANNAHRWTTAEAIAKFKEDGCGYQAAEPDLGKMFDEAYEDQCRYQCGL